MTFVKDNFCHIIMRPATFAQASNILFAYLVFYFMNFCFYLGYERMQDRKGEKSQIIFTLVGTARELRLPNTQVNSGSQADKPV